MGGRLAGNSRGHLLGLTAAGQGRPAWHCPRPQVAQGHDPEHEAEPRLRLRPPPRSNEPKQKAAIPWRIAAFQI